MLVGKKSGLEQHGWEGVWGDMSWPSLQFMPAITSDSILASETPSYVPASRLDLGPNWAGVGLANPPPLGTLHFAEVTFWVQKLMSPKSPPETGEMILIHLNYYYLVLFGWEIKITTNPP